jgi:DNA-binding NarL/FixJ family response regulator
MQTRTILWKKVKDLLEEMAAATRFDLKRAIATHQLNFCHPIEDVSSMASRQKFLEYVQRAAGFMPVGQPARNRSRDRNSSLTRRVRDVLVCMLLHLRDKEITEELKIYSTLKIYVRGLFTKCGVRHRYELVKRFLLPAEKSMAR